MNIKYIIILLLTGTLTISCEDFLTEDPPTFIASTNYYKTAGDARTGVDAVYDNVKQIYNRWWAGIDLYTDDMVSRTRGGKFNEFATHNIPSSHEMFEKFDVYKGYWHGIGRANIVLENVPGIDMDETEKNEVLGEARALRAFYYYQLVRTFGDMPLVTDQDFNKPRSSVNDVYDQIIIPDLKFAEEFCRDGLHDGHVTKWTAKVILAEVYLTRAGWRRTSQGQFVQGDPVNWELARDKAKEVIDNSPHSLMIEEVVNGDNVIPACGVPWDANGTFSKESMFELAYYPQTGLGNWMSRESNPSSTGKDYWGQNGGKPLESEGIDLSVADMRFPGEPPGSATYIPTPDIYDAFEDGDERRDWSLMTRYDAADGNTYLCQPTFRKFIDVEYYLGLDGTNFQYTNANAILYRYADALLIYAEAQNEADGAPNAEAYTAINEVRNRAGLANITGLNQTEFREAVLQERRVEFNAEFKRRFDLIRTNRLAIETSNINIEWTAAQGSQTDYINCYSQFTGTEPFPDHEWLWPIPLSEMELNKENGWEQNDNY